MRSKFRLLIAILPACLARAPAPAQDTAAAKVETFRVSKETLRVELAVSGVLESEKKSEVMLDPEAWAGFVVKKAVEHGERVKKDDPLLVFETDKIDEEIRDLKAGRDLAALAIQQASDDLRWLKETTPLDLASALRAKANADDDLKRFLEVDAPLMEKSARNSLKQAQFSLEYAMEELKQLEKMYKADELVEDSEEIILTRARRDVENAKFSLEGATIRSELTLQVTLPRQKDGFLEAAKRQAIALEKTNASALVAENRKRLELDKMKADLEKSDQKLAKLTRDRARMTIPAPQSGLVYYGKFVRGKWSDPGTLAEDLKPGGTITGRKTLMTVVEPRPLYLRAEIGEKDLSLIRPEAEGKASASRLPGVELSARVERVSTLPVSPGVHEARIKLDLPEDAAGLLPGMECSAKLVAYLKKEALTVPVSAVFSDESEGAKPCVYLARPEGKTEKRHVVLGKKTEGKAEVLGGLSEGDEVLKKRPEAGPQ
jgi:multidrug efflux pump subunit AcrA (membrane-fusion protein)